MAFHRKQSWLEQAGCRLSSWVSDLSAHPFAQFGVILVCGLWFAVGFATELLTAILSILAITLAQMVLNRQNEREADAHRRDVAMHAKVDELLLAVRGARNEMAGIEDLDEEDIAELKEEVSEAIDEAGEAAGDARERAVAKRAVRIAIEEEIDEARAEAAAERAPRQKHARRVSWNFAA
jgi:low affinity Fe/Cu permease